ncbi:MAG: AAA domain-containing protein [Thermodesulfobacteriota bacterium]
MQREKQRPNRPQMLIPPEQLAQYYREILSLLGKSAQNAITNVVGAKSNALIADISYFPASEKFIFDLDTFTIKAPQIDKETVDKIIIRSAIEEEPETETAEAQETAQEVLEGQKTQVAVLKAMWSKTATGKGDRETYFGAPLLCGSYKGRTTVSPLFLCRINIDFFPEKAEFKITKIDDTLAINWNLLSGLCASDDERAALYEGLRDYLVAGISAATADSFVRSLSSLVDGFESLRNTSLITADNYSKAREAARKSTFSLVNTPLIVNAKKANLFLVQDLEALASGKASIKGLSAIGEFLKEYEVGEGQDHANITVDEKTFLDLYFPLVTNKEQVRAARYAEASRITAIEGPPGTGKSHTIVNLITHLVAQGKSVLMTSQKAQALKVVRNRLEKSGLEDITMHLLKGDAASKQELLNRLKSVSASGQEGVTSPRTDRIKQQRGRLRNEILQLEKLFADVRQAQDQGYHDAFDYGAVAEFDKISPDDDIPAGLDAVIAQGLKEYKEIYLQGAEVIRHLEAAAARKDVNLDSVAVCGQEFVGMMVEALELRERLASSPYWVRFWLSVCEDESTSSVIGALCQWWESSAEDFHRATSELSTAGNDFEVTSWWKIAVPLDISAHDAALAQLDECCEHVRTMVSTANQREFLSPPLDMSVVWERKSQVTCLQAGADSWWRWILNKKVRDTRKVLSKDLKVDLTRENAREIAINCMSWCNHWEARHRVSSTCCEILEILKRPDGKVAVSDPITTLAESTRRLRQCAVVSRSVKLASLIPHGENIARLLLTILWQTEATQLPMLHDFFADLHRFFTTRERAAVLGRDSRLGTLWETWIHDSLILLYEEKIPPDSPAVFEKFSRVIAGYDDYRRVHALATGPLKTMSHTLQKIREAVDSGKVEEVRWCNSAESAVKAYRLRSLLAALDGEIPKNPHKIARKVNELHEKLKQNAVQYVLARLQEDTARVLADIGSRRQFEDMRLMLQKKGGSIMRMREEIKFEPLLQALPCWIMSIDDVARIFPLQEGLFDYVIIDEASQCNQATILHLLYRAKNVIVVGDEKQLGPADIRFLRSNDIDALMRKYGLYGSNTGQQFDPRRSLLQVSKYFAQKTVALREHFRSVFEIIDWSNHRFYDGDLVVVTPDRGKHFQPSLEVLTVDGVEDRDTRVNAPEANFIVELIREMVAGRDYEDLTIGVISPFRAQADYINALIVENFDSHTRVQYLLHADTADGFQGDERDVIIYSFRQASNSHQGSVTTIQSDTGRVNVMFTRARRKAIAVTSIPIGRFPEGGAGRISFKDYLAYCAEVANRPERDDYAGDRFESKFETEVCMLLRKRYGYHVATQVSVPGSGYHIDLVVKDDEGRRLAVECDGPHHFDQFGEQVQDDIWRQLYIERVMNLNFYRIPGTRWYREKDGVLEEISEALRDQETSAQRTVASSMASDEQAEAEEMGTQAEAEAREEATKESFVPPPAVPHGAPVKREALKQPAQTGLFGEEEPVSLVPMNFNAWFALSHWGKETGNINSFWRVFAFNIGRKLRAGWELTQKQKHAMEKVWKLAADKGFRFQD